VHEYYLLAALRVGRSKAMSEENQNEQEDLTPFCARPKRTESSRRKEKKQTALHILLHAHLEVAYKRSEGFRALSYRFAETRSSTFDGRNAVQSTAQPMPTSLTRGSRVSKLRP
jgi:hypothetical protein